MIQLIRIAAILMVIATLQTAGASSQTNCECMPPAPPCSDPDSSCPTATWTSGSIMTSAVVGTDTCSVKVFFCSRNITGTPCAPSDTTYAIYCEYKIQKVCFPSNCQIDCRSSEFNQVLQGIGRNIAFANPHNHFAPTAIQWNSTLYNYKTAWRISFPACFNCERDPVTLCTTVTPCDDSRCYKLYKAYLCCTDSTQPNPPYPPCPEPPCSPGVRLQEIPGTGGKTVGECPNPNTCILCGY